MTPDIFIIRSKMKKYKHRIKSLKNEVDSLIKKML